MKIGQYPKIKDTRSVAGQSNKIGIEQKEDYNNE